MDLPHDDDTFNGCLKILTGCFRIYFDKRFDLRFFEHFPDPNHQGFRKVAFRVGLASGKGCLWYVGILEKVFQIGESLVSKYLDTLGEGLF